MNTAAVTLGRSWLVPLRISGTGAAWRPAVGEFVYRPPETWLSKAMTTRWLGAPVVLGHPDGGVLNAETFRATIVGTIVSCFVRGLELWGLARIFDRDLAERAAAPAAEDGLDTSPAVTFAPDEAVIVNMSDGTKLLVEGNPVLIDHLALVERGVWSKRNKSDG